MPVGFQVHRRFGQMRFMLIVSSLKQIKTSVYYWDTFSHFWTLRVAEGTLCLSEHLMLLEPPRIEPTHLLNRELSWLEFNQRVLEEALDTSTPLLDRLKFFCAFSSNLDEFFEVRVAGLKQQMESTAVQRSPDGLTATETLQAVRRRVRRLVERQYACWRNELRPELARHNIRFLRFTELSKADRSWVENFYRAQVRPVLTPLGLDPAHPFPQLLNKSLNTIVQMEITESGKLQQRLAVVQVPRVLPRLVQLPRPKPKQQHYLFLGDVIGHYLARFVSRRQKFSATGIFA